MRQAIALLLAAVVIVMAADKPSEARDVPYTQEDRDRIIRLEEGQKTTNLRIDEGLKAVNQRIDGLESSLNKRIDGVDKRIDDMRADINGFKVDMNRRFDQMFTLTLWGFGVLFGGMGLLLGFVLWDRRTALAPAMRKTKEVDERSELIVKALKEVAAKNPDVKDALKHTGLL
ncbi:MAG: hypothetical protein HQL06_07930 [Nitrospirae bacterium]|nr:hypothetical protein [Nitrospirota bacterium]